jgi:hypothetical protein
MTRCNEIREDLEAFALGALDEAGERRVRQHLATCDECSQIAHAYEVAVNHLALAVPLYRAPSRLKDRLMGGVGSVPPIMAARSLFRVRWFAGAAAAVLAAIAIGGVTWAVMLSSEVGKLRTDNERLAVLTELDADQRQALLKLQGDLLTARTEQRKMVNTLEEQATLIVLALDTELIPTEMQGTAIAPAAKCNYVWSSAQGLGALTCKDLPTTAASLVYDFWATKGEKTVGLGTFVPRADGTAQMLVKFPPDTPGPISSMWITLEPSGTSAHTKPGSQVVLVQSPTQQAQR